MTVAMKGWGMGRRDEDLRNEKKAASTSLLGHRRSAR